MTTIYNTNEYIFYMGFIVCGQEPPTDLRHISPLCVYDRSNCKIWKKLM